MRSLTGAALGWLRRHVSKQPAASAVDDRPADLLAYGQAMGLLEGMICDGVVYPSQLAPTAQAASRMELGGETTYNAFGRPIVEQEGAGAAGAIALAAGMGISGLRATAWLAGDDLSAASDGLRDAAERLVPLVIHASDTGDAATLAGCHALGDVALFQLLPHDAQQALDLTLVARRVAEFSLIPGLVVTPAAAIAHASLPDEALVRGFLGAPSAPLASPTEAQRQLFGADRRRAFRWFDADHPVATATVRGLDELERARLGRELFFWDHVAPLARQAMDALTAETGRPLGFVHSHKLDDAEIVLIATGVTVQTAIAAADHLRASSQRRVGVLGLTWLRPFPAEALRQALSACPQARLAVVEREAGPASAVPALFASVQSALGARAEGLVSAVGSEIRADRLVALATAMAEGSAPKRARLQAPGPKTTGFPRRDALIQSVRNAYPRLDEGRLAATGPGPGLTEGGLAIGVAAHEAQISADALSAVATKVRELLGGDWVCGTVRRPEPGAWYARVQGAAAAFADPGPAAPIDALLLLLDDPGDIGHPLDALTQGGAVFITAASPSDDLWETLPARWRDTVRSRDLSIVLVDGGLDEALDALASWRTDGAKGLVTLDWRARPASPASEDTVAPILRHIPAARTAHDSLPRFWGEVAGPRREGLVDPTPDPLSAAGVVPAYASALEPDPVGAPSLPSLDPEACTACGHCWSSCPDSALGATVIGIEPLLTAASHTAKTTGPAAEALRRNHKHLASRLASRLKKDGAEHVDRERLDEIWSWLSGRLDIAEADQAAYDEAWRATADEVLRLQPVVTESFFRKPEAASKGTGKLFILTMDPRACQGCAICAAVCPEDALTPGDRSAPTAQAARERWSVWESLPDTEGETIAQAQADPGVGRMAGALLSKHVSLAQTGGGVSEPGSGERLAVRLVAAVVEEQTQRRMATLVKQLEGERATLDSRARQTLTESLAGVDLDTLQAAMDEVVSGKADLASLSERLSAHGQRPTFDRAAVLRMTGVERQLAQHAGRLVEGVDGLGRARFGIVFAKGALSEWAGRFPRHPYHAPMTVEPTARGVELARGVIQGLMNDHLELSRSLRRAKVVAAAQPDAAVKLAEIDRLRWEDLDDSERRSCPPLLFVGDATSIGDLGLGWLTRLLSSELAVKVIMLDGGDQLEPRPEPALVAMAHRTAFVLSGSVAYPDHLADGLADALAFSGPAFVHIHAPSPRRQGFAADATIRVAREAVNARAHILFRYDPSAEGAFGKRASLEGNPALDAPWGDLDFGSWAATLSRFTEHFTEGASGGTPVATLAQKPAAERRKGAGVVEREGQTLGASARIVEAAARRLEIWQTLREVTGDASTFTERIREEIESELTAKAAAERAAEEQAHQGALAALQTNLEGEMAARLTDRLMALAGYTGGGEA